MTPVPDLNRTFAWRGSTVRWAQFGAGPPVVLCHGTPWSSFVWRHLINALAADFSVYAWDMIGYGQSDKPDADVSLGEQGELLAALTTHWSLDHPHVVAHDFGGAVAMRAHLLHGVPVGSFILVDIVAIRPWGSPFFRLVGAHPEVFAALPPNLHEALVREYIAGASSEGLAPQVLDALVSPWLDEGQAAFYRQIAQADERFTAELEPLFSAIDVPTLIVWGDRDEWIPLDRARTLAAAIPFSRLAIIDRAGHLVQEDQSTELIRVVTTWLDDQSS